MKEDTNKKEFTDKNEADEEMTVVLYTEEGEITCSVVTIFTANEKDYIVLLPLDENGENHDGNVFIYGYHENPDDPNEEPELIYIDDDDEYEIASDAYDEYLDRCEFDEMVDADSNTE